MGIEAIIGFGLLTASVSWLLSIYPALERRRTLAHQATLLHHAEGEAGITIDRLPASDAMELFSSLAASLSQIRNDMGQFPITYYFRFGDDRTHLSGIIPYLATRAEQAAHREDSASVRLAAVALGGAMDDLLEFVAEAFLRMPTDDKSAIMRAYASEHMTQLVDLDGRESRPRRVA
jgi:hypothetical protein